MKEPKEPDIAVIRLSGNFDWQRKRIKTVYGADVSIHELRTYSDRELTTIVKERQ